MRAQRGFALMVALMIMAFILLLLMSFGALTRIEIQTAQGTNEREAARQNALLGMYIALAQLQTAVGPDQRVTATADIMATADRDGFANNYPGKINVAQGARYWTGVWGNAADPHAFPSAAASQRRLLNWLVSGNEVANVTAVTTGSQFGRIDMTEDATPAFVPSAAVTSLVNAKVTDALSIDGQPARLLVGSGTTGGDADGYVAAPLVKVLLAGETEAAASGGYAWWVGDEGVKARINLADPWRSAAATGADSERSHSFATAQRMAGEQITGLAALPVATGGLESALQPGHVPLLANGISGDSVRARFHDVTLASASVLSDTRRSGLRRDLNRVLEASGDRAPHRDEDFVFPHQGDAADPFYAKPPTWGVLRDFYRFAAAGATLAPQTPTATRQGLHPVILNAGLSYSFHLEPAGGATQTLSARITPFAILWNPYTAPLPAGRYEIGIQGPRRGLDGGVVAFTFEDSDPLTGEPVIVMETFFNIASGEFETVATSGDVSMSRNFYRFTINMTREWKPGEPVSFRLMNAHKDKPYADGFEMVPANWQEGVNLNNASWLNLPSTESVPQSEECNITLSLKRTGESYAYLAQSGALAGNAAVALNPGASNRYYQWIGRVETSSAEGFNDTPFEIAVQTMPPPPQRLFAVRTHVYQTLGHANVRYPPLPVRWIANANARAYMMNRTELEADSIDGQTAVVNPLYNGYISMPHISTSVSPIVPVTSLSSNGEVSMGNDFRNDTYPSVSTRPALWELPVRGQPLFSVADLRHAALASQVTSPGYAVGNSLADFRIKDLAQVVREVDAENPDASFNALHGSIAQTLYDHSYLLNHYLWDSYFFSTLLRPEPGAGVPQVLPNARHRYNEGQGNALAAADLIDDDGQRAAAGLLLEGGFNVNSTSVEAWRALLSAANGLAYDPVAQREGDPLSHPFTRFRRPREGSGRLNVASNVSDYWAGYRQLDPAHIEQLAEAIVEEVKERGPFLSVSDFVNRSLAGGARLQLKGAVQAAIDDEEIGNAAQRINHVVDGSGGNRQLIPNNGIWYNLDGFSNEYSIPAYMGWNTASRTNRGPLSRQAAFAPGDLQQADILASVGPLLTSRSDTFVIRAYGESVNPATGRVIARAWCEALVQRLPEYVNDEHDAAWTPGADLVDAGNRTLGRKFRVVSFRWLRPDDV